MSASDRGGAPLGQIIRSQRPDLLGALVLLGVSGLLTALLALPVLAKPNERLVGQEIDGRHHDAYNYVERFSRPARLDYFTQPATDWPGSWLGTRLGGVAGYNLLVLLSFPLTAFTTFLLARHLAIGRAVSALVALCFAFGPFHWAHAAYHPHTAQLQWLPLALLAMWLVLERPSPARLALLATVSITWVAASFYNVLLLVTALPAAAATYWLGCRRTNPPSGRLGALGVLATLSALGLVGLAYLILFEPEVLASWRALAFPSEDLNTYSARPWSFLVPAAGHPLLGDRVLDFWARGPLRAAIVEHQLFVGLVPLLLAAASAIRGFARKCRETTLSVLAAVGFLMALPPSIQVASIELPAPSALFYAVAPMFRAYARCGVLTVLALLLLAGLTLSRLVDRRRRGIALTLGLLICLELTPAIPWPWHDVLPTPSHRWLAEQPGPLRILDCVRPSHAQQSVGALMPHPTSILGVFVTPPADDLPRRFWADERLLDPVRPVSDCAEPGLASKLAALGYTHLLLRESYRLAPFFDERGFERVRSDTESRVYRVDAPSAQVYTERIGGFSWRSAAASSVRWMGADGWWRVVNRRRTASEVELRVDLVAFHRPRTLTLRLDERPIATLDVETRPAEHTIGPLLLSPGEHRLEFVPHEPPTVPAEVLDSGDRRALSIAVGSWAWSVVSSPPAED